MPTLALLGDSILDNKAYTKPSPDTAAHLRESLGSDWTVELYAQDGATIADIRFQLSSLTPMPDCAVLSVGGNDAIERLGLLSRPAGSAGEVLGALIDIVGPFSVEYERLIADLRARVQRLIVCTIYEPALSNPTVGRLATIPLALLNDRIIRAAVRSEADVIELRSVCTSPADFALEIEPSAEGATKIARAIHRAVLSPLPTSSRIFAT